MPQITGFDFPEVLNVLREENLNDLILLVFSSKLNPQDIARAKGDHRVFSFMNKPLSEEKITTIKEVLVQ